ncbi:ATP-binding protein [Noviherbaspirillum saxi]|uniref:sensor histidine kinase n=1 Tax=Noviherbaspirillum saxi TaxID=2320863 RepID=UPI0011C400BB|nr:ATP-binding protein [Noviherbaspirillum saxi]
MTKNTVPFLSALRSEPAPWIAAWGVLALAGTLLLCRIELNAIRLGFETDSRIAHRLLTQRTVQHDAILATLEASNGTDAHGCAASAYKQVAIIYPQVLSATCRPTSEHHLDRLAESEDLSRLHHRATVDSRDFAQGRYWLVLAGATRTWALHIDIRKMIPRGEWPAAPLHIDLHSDAQTLALQQTGNTEGLWNLKFEKHLSSDTQPFDLRIRRSLQWGDLPWLKAGIWLLMLSVAFIIAANVRRQVVGRSRAEGLLRLRRAERLNTMGELAAGVAHELNQPLTAILANCQAARRLLDQPQTDAAVLREALSRAVEQARRASTVVNRFRTALEHPNAPGEVRPVVLATAVDRVLHLLEPEIRQRQVTVKRSETPQPLLVLADPVALDQILHNLLLNALQAMEAVASTSRVLHIDIARDGAHAVLKVADSGPGIQPHQLPQLFDPFFTTKPAGLGLGLTLCERLIESMGGRIAGSNRATGGAEFMVVLVHAATEAAK